jgi:Zn-finger nucleic acid-binding protein
MNCPLDGTTLQLAERLGVEIDYCPTCRGQWLDRGELDTMLERHAPPTRPARDDAERDDASRPPEKKRKGAGFLGDLLEFGG